MWRTFFGAAVGLVVFLLGLAFAFKRGPVVVTGEITTPDGATTTRQEYRELRWWERLLPLTIAAIGWYILSASIAPEAPLTRAVAWLGMVVLDAAFGACCIAGAAWLLYRRVFRPDRPVPALPSSKIHEQESEGVEGHEEKPDFVREALAGEAVEENVGRLQKHMAQTPLGAIVLATGYASLGFYALYNLPRVVRGDFKGGLFALLLTWETIVGAAEAVAFLLLPALMGIVLVVTLVKRDWEGVRALIVVEIFLGAVAFIGWMAGFLDPLFELLARVP